MKNHDWQYATGLGVHFNKGYLARYREIRTICPDCSDIITYLVEPIPNPERKDWTFDEDSFSKEFERLDLEKQMKIAMNPGDDGVLPEMRRRIRKNVMSVLNQDINSTIDEYERRYGEKREDESPARSKWKRASAKSLIINYREPNEIEDFEDDFAFPDQHYVVKLSNGDLMAIRKEKFLKLYEKMIKHDRVYS